MKLQEYQNILKLPIDDFEVLEAVTADLNLKGKALSYDLIVSIES